MSNLAKLEFLAFDISGQNYLSWVLDVKIYLAANGLGDTIQVGKVTTVEQKAKAMIFLRHHLHENLKFEYLTVKDPLVLWNHLKDKYEHKKTLILPRARYDWVHLRFQDFKTVSDYNSAMFRITSQLTLCGEKITDEEMLEKTFSTFHAYNLLLQQYRERGFRKYCDLISCLLVAEQNNELLMKNHESRPTRYAPLSEGNMVAYNQSGGRDRGRGSDRGRGRGRRRGRGQGREFGREGVEVNFAYQDEKNDSFDIDNFGIDSLGVDNLGVPEDPNDITHLDVGDFLANNRNMAFARLLAQLIRLRAHFLDFPIKTIRLDNAGEFTSQTFNDYCMSIGISVEHSVAHVHTQNGLAESLIKRIQMIARPMIMKAKLPVSVWGHVVLHAATLIHAGYMSDPHTGRSQTGYVFTSSNTAISWRSVKQTMSATSSNHAELKNGYIKGDRTKHILPKFFFTHDLQKSDDIIVQQIRSSDNLAYLFNKALPTATFKKLVHGIGMRTLKELKRSNHQREKIRAALFFP
ncbi:uncharacterized protein Tco_0716831 [Tanacetum coccineum]